MGKKQVVTRIPDYSVWVSFLGYVEKKHGKTHGVIGLELQNALLRFLEMPEGINIEEIREQCRNEVLMLENKVFKQDKTIGNQQKELNILKKKTLELEKENEIVKTKNRLLQDIQSKYNMLHEDHSNLQHNQQKLRNNYDHLQARFNKSQNEVVTLERENSQLRVVVAKIEKLSFLERLFNRLPSEIKQLTTDREK